MDSDWVSGYCATVDLHGTTNWTVRVQLNQSAIENLWNGNYTVSNNVATVTGNQPNFGAQLPSRAPVERR